MRRRGPRTNLGTPIALFLFALVVRVLPWLTTIGSERVVPFGGDTFYHLRRIAFTVANFPAALGFDPYIHYPEGARAIWPPLFDWLVACAVRPFVGALDPGAPGGLDGVERLAIWVPPLLGAATVLVLYRLARRHFGRTEAVSAALLLAVLPAHVHYSRVGFVDHHAAVALVAAWILSEAMDWSRPREPGTRLLADLRVDLAIALALALALLVWPGSLLHGLLGVGFLAAWAASAADPAGARRRAGRLARVCAIAAVAVAPFCLPGTWPQWSPYSPVVLSRFQPWLFGAATLALLTSAWLWGRSPRGSARAGRLAILTAVGVGVAASGLLLPRWDEGLADGARWLLRREAFQAGVLESEPLFVFAGQATVEFALTRLSALFFLLPLMLAAAVARFRREASAAGLLLTVYTAGLAVAALLQKRFANSFAVPFALLSAWSLCAAYRRWIQPQRPGVRRVAIAGALVALLAALAPALAVQRLHLVNHLRWLRGEPLRLSALRLRQLRQIELADWLRENTPPTAGWLDPAVRPEYGVLAPWPLGHVIQYRGRRPTVVDGFGDDLGPKNMALMERYYRSPEDRAVEVLRGLGVRYVVVGPGVEGIAGGAGSEAVGNLLASAPAEREVPLARHRLVYESGGDRRGGPPLYKVYEVVPAVVDPASGAAGGGPDGP